MKKKKFFESSRSEIHIYFLKERGIGRIIKKNLGDATRKNSESRDSWHLIGDIFKIHTAIGIAVNLKTKWPWKGVFDFWNDEDNFWIWIFGICKFICYRFEIKVWP